MANFIGVDLWSGAQVNHGAQAPESFKYMVLEDVYDPGAGRGLIRRPATPQEILHYFQYSPNGTPLRDQVRDTPGAALSAAQATYFKDTPPARVPSKSPILVDALTAVGSTSPTTWSDRFRKFGFGGDGGRSRELTVDNVNQYIESLYEDGFFRKLVAGAGGPFTPEGKPEVNFKTSQTATPLELDNARNQGYRTGAPAYAMDYAGGAQGPWTAGTTAPTTVSTTQLTEDPAMGQTGEQWDEYIKLQEETAGTSENIAARIAALKAAGEEEEEEDIGPSSTEALSPAEFQAAWQATIANNGVIPPQYLRYTAGFREERDGVVVEVVGQPHPQTTALLNLRSQIIGQGIQGRGEEFQQQEFEEQQRRALVAEQQALAGLTGQIGGGQRLAGFDASGAPLYEQLPAQETLQSLIQRANLTGELGGEQTLAQRQFDLDRLLQTAGLTGQLPVEEGADPVRTLAAQQLALDTARLYGTPAPPTADTPTLAQQQFNLERALAAGRLPGVGGLPGDQTLQAKIAESQMDLGEAASTLASQRLAEEQSQFNRRLQQERDLAVGFTDFGQTVASRQQQAEAEMARQALEAQQARAALSAVTGMSQAAIQSPYGYGAFRALGGLGGGAGTAQQQITQQLAPIGFQFPTEAQAGTQVSPQAYFPSGVPTLGSLSQLPRSGQEQLQAVLGMTGTSPSQFGRLAGSITPTVTPQEQRTVTRRKPKVTGGAAI